MLDNAGLSWDHYLMDPVRAHKLGVRSAACTIQAKHGYRCGRWVLFFNGQPVTEHSDVVVLLIWLKQLRLKEDS